MSENIIGIDTGNIRSVNPHTNHPPFLSYRNENGLRCLYDAVYEEDGPFDLKKCFTCERCKNILEWNSFAYNILYAEVEIPKKKEIQKRRRKKKKRRKTGEEEEEEEGGWYYGA